MAKIGYARVSTDEQTHSPQIMALEAAACDEIYEEQASGGDRARPVLARVMARILRGDTLVVVRIDRLARSLAHLLDIIEKLEAKGAYFRSIEDPIDTASAQGKFTLQVLGAAAEFERALIRERTKAGLENARAQGRIGGNPGLRARNPAAIRRLTAARREAFIDRLHTSAINWVPLVKRHRPDMAWADLLRIINTKREKGSPEWSLPRLMVAVRHYVDEGFLPKTVLNRAKRAAPDDRVMIIIAGIKGADPKITLQAICNRLEAMRERTPRGNLKWQPSTVRLLVQRAISRGLLED